MSRKIPHKALVALFFVLLSVVGLLTVNDYTGSYDEYIMWDTLRANLYEYAQVLEKLGIHWETGLSLNVERIASSTVRDLGMAPYYVCAPFLGRMNQSPSVASSVWCLVSFCWFLAGVWSMYAIARQLGANRIAACVAALLLYLSPRMFADGHFSDRDVVLLALILLCLWNGFAFLRNFSVGRGLIFSFWGAMAATIRAPGIIAWGLVGLGAVIRLTILREWKFSKFCTAVTTICSFVLFYVILTPAIWSGVSQYFEYMFGGLLEYGWEGDMFFRGALFQIPENELPWYYLPYMMVTTLPLYTFPLASVGLFAAIKKMIRNPVDFFQSSQGISVSVGACLWIIPVALYVFLRPIVYNGWRHFYFCYAGVLVMMIYGLQYLWNRASTASWRMGMLAIALFSCLGVTAVGMIVNHPHQSSYYNLLASRETMETDYWNTSGENALKKLIACDQRNKDLPLEVGCYFFDIQNARFKLSEEERSILTTTTKKDSPYLYYIENYAQLYNVPEPDGYHVLFTLESYGRLVGTMYEKDV